MKSPIKFIAVGLLITSLSAFAAENDARNAVMKARAEERTLIEAMIQQQQPRDIIYASADEQMPLLQFAGEEKKIPFILLMGQSNMEGAGYPVFPVYVSGIPRVLALNHELQWEKAQLPLGRGVSPGNVFARYYAQLHPNSQIGYVQTAVGGKSLRELSPGGDLYANALKRAKAAMESGELIAILWHQGESDSGNANYPEQLKTFVDQLRKDLGAENVPFIVGELGRYDRDYTRFNNNLATVPERIPNSGVVSSEGLTHRGDELHLSGYSDEIFGCRYLMKYLETREPQLVDTFKPILDKVTSDMTERDNQLITFANPSMSEGESRPFAWDAKGYDFGPLPSIRDTEEYASAPASLRVESDTPVSDYVGTWLKEVRGRKLRITCKMKNEGFETCILRVAGKNAGFQECFSKTVADATNAKEWTEFTAEITVTQEAMRDRLELFVSGKGKAWLDDITIEKID
ncbi:MAG: sialate O-acetylesterase [Pontiellaceae bacterium]|nr:sialate O-acetylesterase [Pontiellaceae bacterium]